MTQRNDKYLDNPHPDDIKIGKLQRDEDGRPFRIINGKKQYQKEEKTQRDKDQNLIKNRWRASGLSLEDWFNTQN